MSKPASQQFLTQIGEDYRTSAKIDAEKKLAKMVAPDQYVGDLISLDYGHADILVHDTQKASTNGIPHGCLLIATRITPADLSSDRLPSDPSLLLIRVAESVKLSTEIDLDRVRLDAVQRANDTEHTYDDSGHTDQFTLNMLRYSGIRCRILGTFRACEAGSEGDWAIHFGSDISNFNAGHGMKIYKPSGPSLRDIVNYRRVSEDSSAKRQIGRLRYSAAVKESNVPESVEVSVQASDFIAQRTALFGMTRSGKSNTTKTIAKALFELRSEEGHVKVGQLIFDPNGEYANDNPQDQGCLRNLQYEKSEYEGEVQTYGSHPHPHDPGRNITKFNFYGGEEPGSRPLNEEQLQEVERRLHSLYQGKQIIDEILSEEKAGYVTDFVNARLDDTRGVVGSAGEYIRLRRRLFVYRCILANAGFDSPSEAPRTKGLFSRDIRNLMSQSTKMAQYADLLDEPQDRRMEWDVAGNFVKEFAEWVKSNDFTQFDQNYARNNDGRNWSDSHLKGLLRIYDNTRGLAVAKNARVWHELKEPLINCLRSTPREV